MMKWMPGRNSSDPPDGYYSNHIPSLSLPSPSFALSLSLSLSLSLCLLCCCFKSVEGNQRLRETAFYILVQWHRKSLTITNFTCLCSRLHGVVHPLPGCVFNIFRCQSRVTRQPVQRLASQLMYVYVHGVTSSSRRRHRQQSLVTSINAEFYLWPRLHGHMLLCKRAGFVLQSVHCCKHRRQIEML